MAAQARHQHQILPCREVLVERRELARQRDHPPDPLGFADDVVPSDPRAATIGTQQRCEHPHHRRLPRAVRPEQRDDGPGLHVQVERVDGGELAEALRQALGFDRGRPVGIVFGFAIEHFQDTTVTESFVQLKLLVG
jgi:hypothetical protein